MKVKDEMQMNEIEIFDVRRLCPDKLSSDLLRHVSFAALCYILQIIWYFVEILTRHTYSMTSWFLESSKQAHCSWAGDATVKVATYSSKTELS